MDTHFSRVVQNPQMDDKGPFGKKLREREREKRDLEKLSLSVK